MRKADYVDGVEELRRRIYRKAKAEKTWRFWGLYVHVSKMETLRAAYQEAKANHGAPGLDGVSFGCGLARPRNLVGESPTQVTVSHGPGIKPCSQPGNRLIDA